jgi:hypothetical protein
VQEGEAEPLQAGQSPRRSGVIPVHVKRVRIFGKYRSPDAKDQWPATGERVVRRLTAIAL